MQLDPSIKSWLEERSVYIQIQNAYFDDQKVIEAELDSIVPFYGDIGEKFILDDYTRFPTLKETFIEVITLARIRKRDGQDVFEVFDPKIHIRLDLSELNPLLLVDGIFIQNPSEVIDISAHDVAYIHVYPAPYRYGPSIFRGIIDIQTKAGDFESSEAGGFFKSIELAGVHKPQDYSTPDYSSDDDYRVPDYRVQLLWKLNIRFDGKPLVEEFYTSDVVGSFEVLLEGFSDQGEFVRANVKFEVVGE